MICTYKPYLYIPGMQQIYFPYNPFEPCWCLANEIQSKIKTFDNLKVRYKKGNWYGL